MASEYYQGVGLKIQIDISVDGFNQETDPYTIDIYCNGEKAVTYNQEDMRPDGDGHWLLPLPTDDLPEGKLYLVVTALVPDEDFEGGIRKEIASPIKIGTLRELG